MLQIKDLKKTYQLKHGETVEALKGISLNFGKSGLAFVLGRSGSGKSTLLNLIGGMDRPTDGEIVFGGRSSKDFSGKDFDAYRNTHVGFVFQEYNLINEYTVRENVGLALELQHRKAEKERIDEILRRVGLTDEKGETLGERRVKDLSGGQKQRVAIARALVKDPKILLADEPTGALDADTGRELFDLLKVLSKERLIIVVTHDRALAETYGDRIIRIEEGRVVADSSPQEEEETDGEKIALVRPRMPIGKSFVLGAKALTLKKVRLAFSFLLSVLTFSVLCFCLTVATVNRNGTQLQMMFASDVRSAVIEADSILTRGPFTEWELLDITEKQEAAIREHFGTAIRVFDGLNPPIRFSSVVPSAIIDSLVMSQVTGGEKDRTLIYRNRIALDGMIVELNPTTGEQDAHLTPDRRFSDASLCRLPQDRTEVAITNVQADMAIRYGFVTESERYDDEKGIYIPEKVTKINRVDELIGKKIGDCTVVGVYETEERYADFEKLCEEKTEPLKYAGYGTAYDDSWLSHYTGGFHPMGSLFVCEGYFDEFDLGNDQTLGYWVRLTGDCGADEAFFSRSDTAYSEVLHAYAGHEDDNPTAVYGLQLVSAYAEIAANAFYVFGADAVMLIMSIVCGIFAVIGFLFLSNYLTMTVSARRRELGILRAMGARKSELALTCFFEGSIVALGVFALSSVITAIFSAVLNAVFGVPLFLVGAVPIFSVLGLCLVGCALATLLPAWKAASIPPVNTMNS